ncbi:MAG: hypothetical protein RLY93_04110 [Sumerlaeia bacterium]
MTRRHRPSSLFSLAVLAFALPLSAQNEGVFVSGSTGDDGAFAPDADIEILVNQPVYHFTTITIPEDVTVTFAKDGNNYPVVWLATQDVSIAGTVDVSGSSVVDSSGAVGGPGGYDGGDGGLVSTNNPDLTQHAQPGQGPGGALDVDADGRHGSGGGFSTLGGTGTTARGGQVYGNAFAVPLLGGSGGAGGGWSSSGAGGGGGGGGGALHIASSTRITVTGTLLANGGNGFRFNGSSLSGGGGSGGTIKLQANTLTVSENATLSARGGAPEAANGFGAPGRIRLEAFNRDIAPPTDAMAVRFPASSSGPPIAIQLPDDYPGLRIVSVDGQQIVNPSGQPTQPDLMLMTAGEVTIELAASNIPTGIQPRVLLIPVDAPTVVVDATPLEGTLESSTASATVIFPPGVTQIVASTSFAPAGKKVAPNGEEITEVAVETDASGQTRTTWVTESGARLTPGSSTR